MNNETRQFRFLEASWVLMIFIFIGTMTLNGILVFKIQKIIDLPNNGFSKIFIIALIFLIPILISRLMSFSKTTVTLNKKEIQVKRSSLIGLSIKSDFELHYSQIDSYVFQDDQNWDWLKIKSLNGKVHRIWKFSWFKNKEFNAFREQLTNEIKWFNQELADNHQAEKEKEKIKVAESIYQGTTGLILGVVSFIIMITVPIILIVFGVPKLSSLGPGLIGLSGTIFIFFKVRKERKK